MGSLTRSGCMDVDDSIGGFNLIWADFPTSLALSNVGNATPTWNVFGEDLVESAFTLAAEYLLRNGTMVCTLRTEHLGIVVREGESNGFQLVRTLFLYLPKSMFLLSAYGQEMVCCICFV